MEEIFGTHLTRHLISGQSECPESNILSESAVTAAVMMLAALSHLRPDVWDFTAFLSAAGRVNVLQAPSQSFQNKLKCS